LILLFFPILLKASWIGDHRSGTCVLAAMSMVLQGKPIALVNKQMRLDLGRKNKVRSAAAESVSSAEK
jgi:hypothetical protein